MNSCLLDNYITTEAERRSGCSAHKILQRYFKLITKIMNQLNEKKDRLEKEIEDELRKIEKLQEELRRRKERVENLQKELKEISEQIRKAKGKGKVKEIPKKTPKNNKRKNTEEFINRKKKRTKVFQEELMN